MLTRWKADLILSTFLCVLSSWLSSLPVMREFDQRISDHYLRLQSPSSASDIVVIMIDDVSLQQFGRWPWERATLARLIEAITSEKPRVLGIDILLAEPQDQTNDESLRAALQSSANVVLVDKVANFPDGVHWVEPLPSFAGAVSAVGHAQAALDSDGLCRRFPPIELSLSGKRYAFAVEVANLSSPSHANAFLGHYGLGYDHAEKNMVVAQPSLIPIFFRSHTLPSISAAELLSARTHQNLQNKIVLVGFGPSELGDRIATPISRGLPTPGVEVHAQIVQAILNGRTLDAAPLWMVLCTALLECLIALQLFRILRGWKTAPALVGLSVAILFVGWMAFSLGMSLPIGSLLCGAFMTPLALHGMELSAVENSVTRQLQLLRRWKVQQKSVPGTDLPARLNQVLDLQDDLGKRFEFFSTLLETTHDLVAVFDVGGNLLFANRAFRSAWGTELPESLSNARARLSEADDAPLVENAGIVEGEAQLGDGLFSVRLAPLPPVSLLTHGGTMLSMTSLAARLERDRAREEALSFVTHELRTPLSAIHNFAEMMIRYPSSSATTHAPETILRESDRLLLLINCYLDVLRTDSGARPLRAEKVLLKPMVERVFETLAPLARTFSIRLRLECKDGIALQADEALLTGVVLNLVSNAIKYASRDSEVLVSAVVAEGGLNLMFHNAGPHIAPSSLSRIFDPFYRADAETAQPGSGLGLSIVKRVVDKHGGTITVNSASELGTTFLLRLPHATLSSGALAS